METGFSPKGKTPKSGLSALRYIRASIHFRDRVMEGVWPTGGSRAAASERGVIRTPGSRGAGLGNPSAKKLNSFWSPALRPPGALFTCTLTDTLVWEDSHHACISDEGTVARGEKRSC